MNKLFTYVARVMKSAAEKARQTATAIAVGLAVTLAPVAKADTNDLSSVVSQMTDTIGTVKGLVVGILSAGVVITLALWGYRKVKAGLNKA